MINSNYQILIDSNCEAILRIALNIASRLVLNGNTDDVIKDELDMLITINGDTKRLTRVLNSGGDSFDR